MYYALVSVPVLGRNAASSLSTPRSAIMYQCFVNGMNNSHIFISRCLYTCMLYHKERPLLLGDFQVQRYPASISEGIVTR